MYKSIQQYNTIVVSCKAFAYLRNSLINALSQGSAWQTALTILVQTLSSCQATDSASFHAVIRAADVASKWPLALVVLAEMPKRHIEGCLVCCSSAMRACRSEWQAAQGGQKIWLWVKTRIYSLVDVLGRSSYMTWCWGSRFWL